MEIYFRFVPRNGQKNYLSIVKIDNMCYSDGVGMWGGKHDVSIGVGCEYTGTVLHEFMHAIGK